MKYKIFIIESNSTLNKLGVHESKANNVLVEPRIMDNMFDTIKEAEDAIEENKDEFYCVNATILPIYGYYATGEAK